MLRRNKKASLELSIRAIVIVVLAMTLLSLGVVFIKKMFDDIGILSEKTFAKITDELDRELTGGSERLIFSQTKINLERGKSSILGWGIKNEGNQNLEYWLEFNPIRCPQDDCPTVQELNEGWFTFKYNYGGADVDLRYLVEPGSQHVKRVELSVPKDAKTGLYLIDLSVYDVLDANVPYSSTDIFLTVS